MRIILVGSRHFAVMEPDLLHKQDIDMAPVVAAEITPGTDLTVTARSHARIDRDGLAESRLGGIGYPTSPRPRHRGIAAVEWTINPFATAAPRLS